MHMKLATASAIALGLALCEPAFAQTGMPPAEDQTEAQIEGDRLDLDAEGPEAGLDATLDEDDPALAADPAEEHDIDGVAVDQDVEVDEPVTAVEPGVDGIDDDVAAGERAAAPGTEPRQGALDELEETLGEMGLEDRELFFGSVSWARPTTGSAWRCSWAQRTSRPEKGTPMSEPISRDFAAHSTMRALRSYARRMTGS
jgi:hypothetical protein